LTLISPNDSITLYAGSIWPITWQSSGVVADVAIEFSIDDGQTWSAVFPKNIGNTGTYNWLVPMVDSHQCAVRILNTTNPAVFDMSNTVFTIYQCPLQGDLDGNCSVDLFDFVIIASDWLK